MVNKIRVVFQQIIFVLDEYFCSGVLSNESEFSFFYSGHLYVMAGDEWVFDTLPVGSYDSLCWEKETAGGQQKKL